MEKLNFQKGKIDKSTYLLHCILPHKQTIFVDNIALIYTSQ